MQNETGAPPPSANTSAARQAVAAILLLVVWCTVRASSLPGSLWSDEIASYWFAKQPLSLLWSNWMVRETNPPLYYTILKGWMSAFGESDLALRGPSLLCGLFTAMLAGQVARERAGMAAGWFAIVLVSLSSAQIYYSLDVRAYALAELAALAALWSADRFVRSRADDFGWRALALYILACSIALYSHTMLAVFWVITGSWTGLWLLLQRASWRRRIAPWVAANAAVALLWSWWIRITLWQIGHPAGIAWITRPTLPVALRDVMEIYGPGPRFGAGGLFYFAWAGFGLVALLVLLQAIRRLRADFALVYPVAALSAPVLLYLVSFKTPVLIPRAFLWGAAPLQVSLAIGLASLPLGLVRRLCGMVLPASYLAGTLALINHPTEEPYRQIAAEIRQRDPHAAVVTNQGIAALALARYCPRPACSLHVYLIRRPEQLPVAPAATYLDLAEAPQLLRENPVLFSLVRLEAYDPGTELARTARPIVLAGNRQTGDALVLSRWERAPER